MWFRAGGACVSAGLGVLRGRPRAGSETGGGALCFHVRPSRTYARAAACLGGSGQGGALGGSGCRSGAFGLGGCQPGGKRGRALTASERSQGWSLGWGLPFLAPAGSGRSRSQSSSMARTRRLTGCSAPRALHKRKAWLQAKGGHEALLAPSRPPGLRSQGRRLGWIPLGFGGPWGAHWRREWTAGTGVCVAHGTGGRWRASCPGPGAWVPPLLGSVLPAPCTPALDSRSPSVAARHGQHPRSWPLPSVLSCLWASTSAIAVHAESLPTGPALLSLQLMYLEACPAASS